MNFKLPQQKKFSVAFAGKAARFFSMLILFSAIAAVSLAQAPSNDNACQAIALTPGATCVYQQFTNANATGSTGVSVPVCGGYVAASSGDVWFKVVVPAGGALTFDTQNGTMTDGGIAIYRGGTCVAISLVPSSCNDDGSANPNMGKITVTGLTVGATVYARVWSKSGTPLGTFGICVTIPVPAPVNDEACTATELIPGATCTYLPFTNESATNSTGIPAPVCAGFLGGDVWFKAVVPSIGALIFDTQNGGMIDGGMAVYTGPNCNNLTFLACDDNSSGNTDMPKLTVASLTPGDTVWVRVWSSGNVNNGTFGICATLPPPPPVNDGPCTATEIPVEATCTYNTYTNENALGSSTISDPVCANYLGSDVWFKLVVPAGGAVTVDTKDDVMTDGGMAIYSGTCDNLTVINCDDDGTSNSNMPKLTLGGLTPGDTLWVRIWENGDDNNGTFGICATIPPPAPSYDDACNAVEIIADTVCNFQTFTTENATGSNVPDPGCASYNGADVWFKVVVPPVGALIFDSQTDVITDGGMAVYSGNCNNLTLIDCDDDASNNGAMPKLELGGLTPGDTLWVRFWEYNGNDNGTFGICITIPPPPPANDNPCTAIQLIADTVCNYQTFTNASATNTSSVPAPGCGGYAGGDVWFKVVVPAGGGLILDTDEGVMTDGGMAVYSGATCDNLTLISCNDNSSANGNMPRITAVGLTPGDTLWVRVWENGNDNNGTFGICVTLPPPPPVNDDPCNAVELVPATTCTYQTFTNESATGTTGVPAPGCAGYSGGDVWFRAIVPAGGAITFDTDEGVITDGGMAVYSGTCTNLTLIDCDDNSSANGTMPKITIGSLTPGDTLWVRVWENGNNDNGSFGICASIPPPPPANDEPCNSFNLIPDSTCTYQTFTNENATNTPGVPAPGCSSYLGSDVWFNVVVPSGGALIFDSQTDFITDGGMAIYTGTCNNLTLVDCDDDGSTNGNMPFITAGGLNPGDTVWVRFWEYGNNDNGTFGICVKLPPPGPVNDDPCGAIELTPSNTCTYQTFTNENAYGTASVPDPGCGFYSGGDVWFKTIVPAGGALTFDTQSGVVTDGGLAVYTGSSCSNLTLVQCDDNSGAGNMPKMTVGGLNTGDTVWVRFWENGNNNNGTFGICVTIPPPPPANDNPCGAFTITASDSCNFQTFSNEGSYATASVPAPPCGDYQGADVWFQIASPAAGALNINTEGGTLTDAAMAVYQADSCTGVMTLIACDDNGSGNPGMPFITATGITPGSTVWIRVWSPGGVVNAGTFGICAVIPPLQPATFSFSCARDTSFNCNGGDSCFTLTAIIPDIHALTDRYAINPLSSAGCFNPYSDPGSEGPSTDLNRDDIYSDVIPLPFTFPFYGSNYNSLVASTNGYISFDPTLAGNFSHWNIINGGTPQNLPSTFYDRALIMGPYHDLDPFTRPNPFQRIKYNITGQAPHRRWILSFSKVPLFSTANGCDTLKRNTHQIVLYEGTGVVEVFLFEMQNCLAWNQGRAMVGMQDFSRTRAIMAPGRRATDAPWGRLNMNESWRFVPIGGPTLFKRVELFDTSGHFLATGDTSFLDSASLKVDFRNLCALNRLPAGYNTLLVRAVYQKFNDPTQEEIGADTVRIFIPNLKVNFDVTKAQCTNPVGAVAVHAINGVPPLRFSADSGRTWQSDSSFVNLSPGTYYIKVQDAAGCARDTIVTIDSLSPLAPVFTVTNPLCNGGTGTVVINTNGVRPIKYSSDGGITYQYDSTFILPAGTYNFNILDTAGCTKDSVITITEPTALTALYGITAATCNGAADGSITVNAAGGTGPYTYSFDNGIYGNSGTASFVAGVHTVSIKDDNGCTKDTTLTITEPAAILVAAVTTPVTCNGASDGTIAITASGGTGLLEYSSNGGTAYQPGNSFTGLPANTYSIRIKDANGCTKDTTIIITEPAAIFTPAVITAASCNGGNSGSIVISPVGGTGTYEYSTDGGANYLTGNTFSSLIAGSYTIRVKDANGCIKDTTIIVTEPSVITSTSVVTSPKCTGGADGTIVITAAGGTPGYQYSSDAGVNYQTGNTFTVAAGTYTIRIKDANSCIKDTTITVADPGALLVNVTTTNESCSTTPNGQITASATGGTGAYNFSTNGTSFQSSGSFTAVAQGSYTVTVRDANGCTATAPATVGLTFDLSIQGSADTVICDNGRVKLNTISNAQTFSWTPANSLDDATIASPFASPNVTTEYYLTATLGNCTLKDTVKIVVTAAPTVFAGNDIQVIKGGDAQLHATVTNTANFNWTPTTFLNNPNSLSPIAVMPQQTTTYTITVFNLEGCSKSDSVTVEVLPYCIKVKNAFTPNGDGVNDTWMVYDQFDCLKNVRVQVFNRYGSKVYESSNYRNEWKGTYSGQSLPDATYYYVIDFTLITGRVQQVRGDVTILR